MLINIFFHYLDNLPKELILIIGEYIPNSAKIPLNKELYMRYHDLFKEGMPRLQLENYIRTTIRQDHDFVFYKILQENYQKWFNMKKYLYKTIIFANYVVFLDTYCSEYKSTKCKTVIKQLIEKLGLCKNQHKKNIIRNIIWNH